jgi:hypothetical protein
MDLANERHSWRSSPVYAGCRPGKSNTDLDRGDKARTAFTTKKAGA